MTTEKILSVVSMYRKEFEKKQTLKKRLDLNESSPSKESLIAHAHYLLDGIEEYVNDPGRKEKANRHLGSVQIILLVCGWYTLSDVMNHNRSDSTS